MADEEKVNSIITGLCANQRLKRERELLEVKKMIDNEDFTKKLIETILTRLSNISFEKDQWEAAAGLISASVRLLDYCNEQQTSLLYDISLRHLDHQESRVRKESGELLTSCVLKLNQEEKLKSTYIKLVDLIKRDLKRDPSAEDLPENEKVRQKIVEGQEKRGKTSSEIFHESAGWRHLETSMAALKTLFGRNKNTGLLNQDLFDLLQECSSHSNRFIRENSFYICSAVLDETLNSAPELIKSFSQLIHKGLSDNWSQVRMSSSDACRSFLFALDEKKRTEFYSLLLPPIALNRYYIAAGVRIHNQDTWRKLFPSGGSEYVNINISSFVAFYCKQIAADNHAVREAACACIAELAQKCSPDALENQWEPMLKSLIDCFGDDSWPVRDATCIASGNFVNTLPEVTKPMHPVLYQKFLENCMDPIASVRQGGATSLGYLIKANLDYLEPTIQFMKECFDDLKKQEAGRAKNGRLESGPGQFGVVRRITAEEDTMENNTMYSCGSLAPKMKAKKDQAPLGTGCSACTKFTRDEDYWERVDGSIFILSSLCRAFNGNNDVSKTLGKLVGELGETLMRNRHFEEHHVLYETATKQMILIAHGLGKQVFKNHLQEVFDIVFYAAESQVLLTKAAAEECLAALSKFLGESILRGRVELTHFEDLDVLDRALRNPIKVPVHEVTGMKTAEDNYGAFISMTPGYSY